MNRYTSATLAHIPRSRSSKTRAQRKIERKQEIFNKEVADVSAQLAVIANDPNMTFVTGEDHVLIYRMFQKRETRLKKTTRGRKILARRNRELWKLVDKIPDSLSL